MNQLIKYDTACRAIAEAKRVDEVKSIRDISIAMKAYARQAGNREMEADAVEIRMRATRCMDQMRQGQKTTIGLAGGAREKGTQRGTTRVDGKPASLTDAGINKNLAHEGRKLGALSELEFEQAIETARGAIGKVVKAALQNEDKAGTRAERERELGAKILAMPNKQYGVIYADPPWRFEPYSRETGMDRAADNHYSTMSLEELKALNPPAANDCVLFIWATAPMLPEALIVMRNWGFTYKSHVVWIKDRLGTGYWYRNKHELLLVGTIGEPPAPAPGTQASSVIEASIGPHSKKPDVFSLMIKQMFPTMPKLDMLARGNAPEGWDFWGNETENQNV